MSVYYVDSRAAGGDGLTPETAAVSYRILDIRPGDTVLFRRGSIFRDALLSPAGTAEAPICYGAYGEGEKPAFWGSVDLSSPDCWVCVGENLWRCTADVSSEAGNFIFNGGEDWGILAWEKEDLNAQGKWHDTRIDSHGKYEGVPYELLMYSQGNPGEVYRHIECAVFGARVMASAAAYVRIENLAFRYSGVHGFQCSNCHNVTISGCEFEFIGGVVWSRELRIRFGNAVELWDDCHDVTMENCLCREVYDSCFTHQGPDTACIPARNLRITGNHFERYGMAAYEARDKVTVDALFADNTCIDAGVGFTMQDETPPRKSEIWPQPMGHHLFIWRMPTPTDGGRIVVRGNRFGAAPHGAAVYSIVSPEAEAQFVLEDNRYELDNVLLAVNWGGKAYQADEFEAYRHTTGLDKDSVATL